MLKQAEEEENRRQEEQKVEKFIENLREEVAGTDTELEKLKEAAKPLDNATGTPETMLKQAGEAEKVAKEFLEVVDTVWKSLMDKPKQMEKMHGFHKVKREILDLQQKVTRDKRQAEKVNDTAKATREKATKKAAAIKKEQAQKDEFSKHDADGDGQLNRSEVATFAKAEYEFDLSEEVLDKIMKALEPIDFPKFGRLRSQVAIAKSEVKARQKRAEEE